MLINLTFLRLPYIPDAEDLFHLLLRSPGLLWASQGRNFNTYKWQWFLLGIVQENLSWVGNNISAITVLKLTKEVTLWTAAHSRIRFTYFLATNPSR